MPHAAGLVSAPQGSTSTVLRTIPQQLLPNVDGELTMSWECPEYLTESFSFNFPVGGKRAGEEWHEEGQVIFP